MAAFPGRLFTAGQIYRAWPIAIASLRQGRIPPGNTAGSEMRPYRVWPSLLPARGRGRSPSCPPGNPAASEMQRYRRRNLQLASNQ
jgi:hypothetical protein